MIDSRLDAVAGSAGMVTQREMMPPAFGRKAIAIVKTLGILAIVQPHRPK
jgi:hypothetical protein